MVLIIERAVAERRFIESGLYRLTEQGTPSLHSDTLSDDQRMVYKALCSAAKKMSLKDLKVLCAAFDGVSIDGATIHGSCMEKSDEE